MSRKIQECFFKSSHPILGALECREVLRPRRTPGNLKGEVRKGRKDGGDLARTLLAEGGRRRTLQEEQFGPGPELAAGEPSRRARRIVHDNSQGA